MKIKKGNENKRFLFSWADKNLQDLVRKVFENRYGRELSNREVLNIALDLVGFVETNLRICKEKQ